MILYVCLSLEYIQTSKNNNTKCNETKKKQMRKGRNKEQSEKSQRKSIINIYRQRDTHRDCWVGSFGIIG